MQKIVINTDFGGFGLSDEAIELYGQLAQLNLVSEIDKYGFRNYYCNSISGDNYFSYYDIKRDDQHLVQVVQQLGDAACGDYSTLKVVEIPDDVVVWHICEYDGIEYVAENHRTWH
jgi:hypothetical protein